MKKLLSIREKQFPITRFRFGLFQIGIITAILYFISFRDYLLFHALTEFITAAIVVAIFLLTWNSRKYQTSNFYLFFGVAFLVVGFLIILHALAYKGMPIFTEAITNANLATQLWLAIQFTLALTFLIAPFLLKRKLGTRIIVLFYFIILIFFLFSIFFWKNFPLAYQEGTGLTLFKSISEYIVALCFLASIYLFYRERKRLERKIFKLLVFVLALLTLSTIAFTMYVGVYSFFNILGHLFRIMAFYGIYLVFVEYSLMEPYRSIFRELYENKILLEHEKNEAMLAKEEWEKTFDSVPDLIAILDKNHKIVRVNKAMADKLGTPNDKCVGLNCYQCVHNTNHPVENCPHSLTIMDNKEHIAEIEEKNLGGTFLISTTPFFDKKGELAGSIHVARDITERKKMEKAKDEFISLASHQLRTPLANIRLSSDLMIRGLEKQTKEEQRSFLEEIIKSTKRMGILVSNLLNISRMEMGNFDIKEEAIAIGSSAHDIAAEFIPLAMEKNINYKIEVAKDLPVVYFDENVLRIILENLISNSLRYTNNGGFISFVMKKDNGKIIISVADSGCGIPENEKDEIFKKSFRTSFAKSITSEGAGLGMYMVKQVCDRIGVDIWFESEPGKGTVFYVSLCSEKDAQLRII